MWTLSTVSFGKGGQGTYSDEIVQAIIIRKRDLSERGPSKPECGNDGQG